MFFILNPDMKIVKGSERDICHSLLDGKTYYFDGEYKRIIRLLLERKSVEEIKRYEDNQLVEKVKKFLLDKHIGIFDEKNDVYVKTINKSFFKDSDERMKKFEIYSVMVRLNTKCNLSCSYCSINNDKLIAPCMCFCSDENSVNPYLDMIIQQALKLGVRCIEIIGGEPFLDKEKLYSVLKKFSETEIRFVIYTNGLLLEEEDIIELAKNNIYIVIVAHTFLDTNERQLGEERGYVKKIKNKIKLLDKYCLKYHIEFLINKHNEDELNSDYLKTLIRRGKVRKKYMLPSSGCSIFETGMINTKIGNYVIGLENYERAEQANLCFRKGPFVDVDGKIYPCIGVSNQNHYLGDIRQGLYKVYKNKRHKRYWGMNNSEDKECQDCAERLMCLNCKAYKILYGDNCHCVNKK